MGVCDRKACVCIPIPLSPHLCVCVCVYVFVTLPYFLSITCFYCIQGILLLLPPLCLCLFEHLLRHIHCNTTKAPRGGDDRCVCVCVCVGRKLGRGGRRRKGLPHGDDVDNEDEGREEGGGEGGKNGHAATGKWKERKRGACCCACVYMYICVCVFRWVCDL